MFRTQLNEATGALGALAYRDATHFRPGFDHSAWLKTVDRRVSRARRSSDAVKHHDKYYGGRFPIWAVSDLLDFSDISRRYEGLPTHMQWDIAERLGVCVDLESLSRTQQMKAKKNHPLVRWFEHLTIVRNTGAHHSRLWNRSFIPIRNRSIVEMGFPDTWHNDPFWSGSTTAAERLQSGA